MKLLAHPSVRLLGVAVAVGVAVRALFFLLSQWLWHFAVPVDAADLLPWVRWAMVDRDGLEPYALLAFALVQIVATGFGFVLLARATPRWQAAIAGLLLIAVGLFAYHLPPQPPLPAIDPSPRQVRLVVAGSLLAAFLLARSVRRSVGAPALLAAMLFPICFLATGASSNINMSCVLAPALRLAHGVSPRAMYIQYDLLPSLLAMGWTALGASPLTFWFVCAATYYALLIGLFVIARRMFSRPQLAGPMVLAIVLVRMYAAMGDASALPQVTPLRLDLWTLPLAAALAAGLRRWPVGLVLGLLFVLLRGMGELYLGSYALALVGDFWARRYATPADERAPLLADARLALRETAPSLALIALAMLIARLIFGSFGSQGLALYSRLGVGMLRVAPTSFYWWLLPLTGAVGWLAFARRSSLSPRRAEAAILAVGLLIANSIYFFGRSHEHNLINTGAAFLFSLFLALDLAWPSAATDPPALRCGFRLAPYLVVAVCAYNYSGRVVHKLDAQQGIVLTQRKIPGEPVPAVDCDQLKRAAGDDRLYFLAANDYWYYAACDFTPRGYIQPVFLNVLRQPLVEDLKGLLDSGVKIAVPRDATDFVGKTWPILVTGLAHPDVTETPAFFIYRRSAQAQK